ncbi:MAG: 50S ribosomal protein L23 [Candidatus Ratteibacteria bacterium]|nr:50S ribosomal protein L23 [Candidatus Ratteibacteria bacterium]
MKSPYRIVKGLVITEKMANLGPYNKYAFKVDSHANKIEVKKAIEEVYKVKVDKVNTLRVKGKKRRVRWQEGKTAGWKKAVVTLKPGDKIEIT